MQEIFTQLNTLVVLTGVSVAVVQYLFINYQTHLKDFISSLKKLNFDETNDYDLGLKQDWESAISRCKKHTYLLNPNNSILAGFVIIISLVLIYISTISTIFETGFLQKIIFTITVFLLIWLLVNAFLLWQIFKKEKLIKSEFDEIDKQHQLVEKVLDK